MQDKNLVFTKYEYNISSVIKCFTLLNINLTKFNKVLRRIQAGFYIIIFVRYRSNLAKESVISILVQY